jgi:hypothetical protein
MISFDFTPLAINSRFAMLSNEDTHIGIDYNFYVDDILSLYKDQAEIDQ